MYEELITTGLIGTDEAGKGDYFGPLAVAACYLNDDIHAELTGTTSGLHLPTNGFRPMQDNLTPIPELYVSHESAQKLKRFS